MFDPTRQPPVYKVLIIVPGAVNYFYNQCGRRMAEALGQLGCQVRVAELGDDIADYYHLGLISNVYETSYPREGRTKEEALDQLRDIRRRCQQLLCVAMESVATRWFKGQQEDAREIEADGLVDLGVFDQRPLLREESDIPLTFAFCGLTPSEKIQAQQATEANDDDTRTIPWTFIGHQSINRVALVDYVLQTVDPRGFVYLPNVSPIKETGSAHINQQQYEMVLRRTRFQVWCTHHGSFYVEGERLRMSLLTGSLPVKVVDTREGIPPEAPLQSSLVTVEELPDRMNPMDFRTARMAHYQEWLDFPTLADEMRRLLTPQGRKMPAVRKRQAS